jgi:hypothetical protein
MTQSAGLGMLNLNVDQEGMYDDLYMFPPHTHGKRENAIYKFQIQRLLTHATIEYILEKN